jgi:hypothetical protein
MTLSFCVKEDGMMIHSAQIPSFPVLGCALQMHAQWNDEEQLCGSMADRVRSGGWFFIIPALTGLYLYVSLFGLSGIPYFRTGDEDSFWTFACRMLSGQVFLRNFHQFTPPGADLTYAALFRVFGPSMSTINWSILVLGLALALVVFRCARFLLRPSLAALAALCTVAVIYGDRLDATHHWFSSLSNLVAILILFPRRTSLRIIAAGAFLALAAFFTQTRGASGLLACCAAFLWERHRGQISTRLLWRRVALIFMVTFLVWLALSWRFISQAGLAEYWYHQVVYLPMDADFPMGFLMPPFVRPSHPGAVPFVIDRIFTYLILLLVCPWVASQCIRGKCEEARNPTALFLLASLGVLQTIEVMAALNWNRMAAVAIPSMILTIYLISRQARPRGFLIPACWSILAGLSLAKCLPVMIHHYTRVTLPTGAALFEKQDAEEVGWLVAHTRPGDAFFEVATTRLYAPLQLRNPTPVELLTTHSYTLTDWVSEVVLALDRSRTRYVLWSQPSGIGSVQRMHITESDHLDPLRTYLQDAYSCIWTFGNGDQIWERRDRASEANHQTECSFAQSIESFADDRRSSYYARCAVWTN